MRFRFKALGAAVAAFTCMFTLLSPVTAGADEALPADAVAVLDSLAAGNPLTAADRVVLSSYPEIASQVVDPARTTSEAHPVMPEAAPDDSVDIAASSCWTWTYDVTGYTLLGATAYVFHHEVHWCTDGSRVLGMHYRNGWATQLEGTMYWRGLQNNSVTPTPNWEAQSFMQASIENCIFSYGCIKSNYPWSRLYLYGNGGTSSAWGH